MGTLFITSDREGAGKTALCAGLARVLARQGQRATLFKALRLATPDRPDTPDQDAAFFARLNEAAGSPRGPVALDPTAIARGLTPALLAQVRVGFDKVSQGADHMVVEMPPLGANPGPMAALVHDMAAALGGQVLVVVAYRPELSPEAGQRLATPLGARLLGLVINGVTEHRSSALKASLSEWADRGVPLLGAIPEDRAMLAVSVAQIVGHLQGQILSGQEKAEALVENVMIGGRVLEPGESYFSQREAKVVVVLGDRPDIQMAALGTPTRCLILTGGRHPIPYVQMEAEEEEVPLILVSTDTVATVSALEDLLDQATVHHPEKADRFADLMAERLAQEPLLEVFLGSVGEG